jgi:hypothetical protein
MDEEIIKLLEQFENRIINLIEGTSELDLIKKHCEKTGAYNTFYWHYWDVKYGWRKSCSFKYEILEPNSPESRKVIICIGFKGCNGWIRLNETKGKALKIICNHGETILKNIVEPFKKSVHQKIERDMQEEVERLNREEERAFKERKQLKKCKSNLEKVLNG